MGITKKQEQIVIDVINKMFEISGHAVTYDDIKDRKDTWYNDWSMTEDNYQEWQCWGKKYLKSSLRMSDILVEREMAMIGLMWGLRFSVSTEKQYEDYCKYANSLEEPDYNYHIDDPSQHRIRVMTMDEFIKSKLYVTQPHQVRH